MAQPTLWRIEIIHPLLVHLPIAFLITAAICVVAKIVVRGENGRKAIDTILAFLVTVGTIGAWVALWSGEYVHDIVNRVICDPTVMQNHKEWAWRVAYASTAAFVCLVSKRFAGAKLQRLLSPLLMLLVLGAATAVGFTAHLGASLVYVQGAAVHQASPDCHEFAD